MNTEEVVGEVVGRIVGFTGLWIVCMVSEAISYMINELHK
jgi:hypothetical protein